VRPDASASQAGLGRDLGREVGLRLLDALAELEPLEAGEA
jgi:hypothetical protein